MSIATLPVGGADTPATRVRSVLEYLKSKFFERDEVIEGIGVALIAKKHLVQIGAPGTAKSMLTDALAALGDLRYFSQQFSQFTSEDDTFGPKSIKRYRETDQFNRNCDGFLPTAELYFADEIGKASHAVHDPLLKALNERIYRNGDEVLELPLVTTVAASNEFLHDEPAFWDRFHIRYIINYIKSPTNFQKMLENPISVDDIANDPDRPVLAKADLDALREQAKTATLPAHIVDALVKMRQTFHESGIIVSDRRFRDATDVLKAVAALNERSVVDDEDFLILQHMFWTEEKEIKTVREVVQRFAGEFIKQALKFEMMLDEMRVDISDSSKLPGPERALKLGTAAGRLKALTGEVNTAIEEANRAQRNSAQLKSIKAQMDDFRQQLATTLVGSSA